MADYKRTYEEILSELDALREENLALKSEVREIFQALKSHYPEVVASNETEQLIVIGKVFKILENSKYALNEQLSALDSVDDGIAIFDLEGRIVFCNKSFPKLFKINPDNLIDAHWRDLFKGPTLGPIKEFLRELNPHYPVHKEVVIPFPKHQSFFNSSIYPLKNQTFLVNVKDVTAEKEKLFTIQEQALLLRSSGEFMAVCNDKFEFTFLNEAGAKLFSIYNNWAQRSFLEYIENSKDFEQEIIPRIYQRNGWIGELMVKTETRVFPVNCEVIPFKKSIISEGGFYVVLRDVTEKKDAIKKLVDAKDEAEKNMQVRQEFLAKMSHEIRTPMNAIIGLTNLLIDSGLSGKKLEFANSIKLSADNLLVIINDILDLSKIESGKLSFENVRFDFKDFINGVKSIFEYKIAEKGLDFNINIDPNIPQYLEGDPTRLNQILLNLISNAEKFTSKGSVSVLANLVESSKDKCKVQFEVKDTGIGIAKENLEKIFQAFTQESNKTTRLYGGTGLGLAIVQQLVNLQNGKIWVESRLNKGSSFYVEIEYGISDDSPEIANVFNEDFKDSKLKRARIIMAEDYPMNRLLAKGLFDKWGLNLTLVNSGKELLNDLNLNSYDIILMDIQMPDIDGLEATRILRKRGVKTPVIAITAHAFKEEQVQCAKAGMNDFLSKPFDEKDLKEKLITYLNLKPDDLTNDQWQQGEEFLPSTLEYFSLDYVKELGAGDDDFVTEMMGMFLNQVPNLLNNLILALNQGDKSLMAKFAHTVQSSFVMIERKDLKEDLKRLEMWGKGMSELENPIGELSSILQKSELVIKAVGDYLGKPVNVDFTPIEVLMNVEQLKDLNVDFSKLEELGEGDVDFQREMVNLYMSQTSSQIEDIVKLLKEGNIKEIGIIVHNMIASFDLIGCEVLISYSRRLEESCLNKSEIERLKPQIEDFLELTKNSIKTVEQKAKSLNIL